MELHEHIVYYVNAKIDQFCYWIRLFSNPLIVVPGSIVVVGLSPHVMLKLAGPFASGCYVIAITLSIASIRWQNPSASDLAYGIFWHPVWTAFCSIIRGHTAFRRLAPSTNNQWKALVAHESESYDCLVAPLGIQCSKEDWIALRVMPHLIE